jgi:glycosyltransferase involved in cell wall biosynthesis
VKIIHVPFSFHPDPVGGTEVYVEALARQQQLAGMSAMVAAPGRRDDAYVHRGLSVFRFQATERVDDIRHLYGEGDGPAADAFAGILQHEKPDLVHLHAFTSAVSLRLVREAKRRGIPVIFSYHTPTASCQRGTLLRWGTDVCDGTLDVRRCSQCSLHGLGLVKPLSTAAGWIPPGLGRTIGAFGASGAAWTVLRTTELVALQHQAFQRLMCDVNHVVALCQWAKDLLLRNGVPGNKITVSRQGLWAVPRPSAVQAARRHRSEVPLWIMFLGRLDPTKGVHLLIEAIRSLPELRAGLAIYGVVQGARSRVYLEQLKHLASGDIRIRFHEAIPSDEVVLQMQRYDVVAVPSQWLETGPLVVLEAFAAGIPVLGSKLGGIGELVTDGVDGMLVEPASIDAWRTALNAICVDRALLPRLRKGIRQPRRIADVESEISQLYTHVCADGAPGDSTARRDAPDDAPGISPARA